MIRTEIDSMPAELDDIRRKIMQLEIEEAALERETDKLSADRLEKIRAELAAHREKCGELGRALAELEKPICDEKLLSEYIRIVKERLDISDEEFERIMAAPAKQHTDYPTDLLLTLGRNLRK